MRQVELRICLVADYSGYTDEGMKKMASYLAQELSKHHKVKTMNIKNMLSTSFWREIRQFQPQIIHYIPGPSILSFSITKELRLYSSPAARTVMSATHPSFYGLRGFYYGPYYALSSFLMPLIPLLKPDLVLVQSRRTEEMFRKLGCKTKFLPGGVDVEKFVLVSPETKRRLREKYGLDTEIFSVLHVGSFRKWRNVQALARFKGEDTQVLILGNTTKIEKSVYHYLEKNGCLVWDEYVENIEEFYQLADCYVFPTTDSRGSIEMPLSVLEAMACNLPVIITRFGALEQMFQPGEGVVFCETVDELSLALDKIKGSDLNIKTREKVMPYSWNNIAETLGGMYLELTGNTPSKV